MIGDPIPEAVQKGLRRICFLRRVVFCLFLAWLPLMAIASLTLPSADAMAYLALGSMGVLSIPALACYLSTCPRCRHLFFFYWRSNAFASRCMNCGVPLSGEPSEE